MADLADMIKNMLDDPGTVDKLKSVLGGSASAPSALPDGMDTATILKITKAMKHMNSKQSDDRTRLLRDLKPYISPARAKRVDEAVDIIKMLSLVDALKNEREGD